MTITITPRKVLLVLLGVVCALVIASLLGQFSAHFFDHRRLLGFVRLFHLDEEINVPAYLSSLGLLCAALLLLVVAHEARTRSKKESRGWFVLSLIFFFLSVDEAVMIHEMMIDPIKESLAVEGYFYFGWVVPGLIFVTVVGAMFLPFLWRLESKLRLRVTFAGMCYVGGALGMEMVGSNYAFQHGKESFSYEMITTFEETMEMCGIVLFLHALLAHLAECQTQIAIAIGNIAVEVAPPLKLHGADSSGTHPADKAA